MTEREAVAKAIDKLAEVAWWNRAEYNLSNEIHAIAASLRAEQPDPEKSCKTCARNKCPYIGAGHGPCNLWEPRDEKPAGPEHAPIEPGQLWQHEDGWLAVVEEMLKSLLDPQPYIRIRPIGRNQPSCYVVTRPEADFLKRFTHVGYRRED